jgi:leader peptidase (prepilin peptidase)/N-methyltransferase
MELLGQLIYLLVLGAILGAVVYFDLKSRIIPHWTVLALLGLGVLSLVARILLAPPPLGSAALPLLLDACAGALVVSLPLGALCGLRPQSIGGGDVKLLAAAGFGLGVGGIVLAFVAAVVLGGVHALVLLARGRGRGASFAFGPHLCAGIAGASLEAMAGGPLLALLS